MIVLNIVNSFIGKKGNIGLRTSYIIKYLNEIGIKNYSYSRGNVLNEENNKNMGILGHLPRILNAYRIYINKNYNHRKLDIKLFELFVKSLFKEDDNQEKKICHIWESSPKLIDFFKAKGYKVVLDVPIAPTSYAITTFKYYYEDIKIDYSFNIKYEKESYEKADYIITPSNFVTEKICELGISEKKIFTIPFGTDIKSSEEKTFNKNYDKDGIDYCFAGNINSRKGVQYLLEAWNDDIFVNDRLHLCGRLYPEIEKLIKKYNFKNVVFPGFVNTSEYFKKCDVYVFPSLLEGSSKSIYEAMNSSLPSIVTRNSGSIIDESIDGFIVEIANPQELREKMLIFKQNPQKIKEMGMKAYKKVKEYSWEAYAQNVNKVYKRIENEEENRF